MKKGLLLVSFGVAMWVLTASVAAKAGPLRDLDFERKIDAELRPRDPHAADLFADGTAAYDRGDYTRAASLFEQVRADDPWFVHATRRLCGAESRLGHRDRAISLCREATAADASPANEAALALALLSSTGGTVQEDDVQQALRLASEASFKEDPPTAATQIVLCEASARAADHGLLRACSERLLRLAPDEPAARYFAAIAAADAGRLDDAFRELEISHAKGLPDEAYKRTKTALENAEPPLLRWGRRALYGFLLWLAVFALLFGAGAIMSAATLRAAARAPVDATGHARGADATLRRTYRVVLWLTCAYYYASLPIVACLVVAAGLGAVYLCLAIGQIPIRLVLIGLAIICASLWAIAKSLFVRRRDEDPGDRLDLSEHPRLRATLDEVAQRIGTRPVDAVFVAPSSEVAVFERGGMLRQLRGDGERCLVVGAAALGGLRVRELKSILAHEYGHFRNADTAGGGFALAVRRSLLTLAIHLAQARAASALNPTWWFVRGFYAVFLRISQGASRLQEVLADRWAAFAYGSDAFVVGLKHMIDRSVRFDAHLSATIGEVVPQKAALANVYSFVPASPVPSEKVEEVVAQIMNRPAAPSDSHPRPADRIAWVTKLGAPAPQDSQEDASTDAWDLFTNRSAIEERMTAVVRARLAERGIQVVAPAAVRPSVEKGEEEHDGDPAVVAASRSSPPAS